MSQITIDKTLLVKLNGVHEQTEFRGENGQLLGHFIPVEEPLFVTQPEDRCPYTPEELERMRNQTGGRSLAEIWKSLGVTPSS